MDIHMTELDKKQAGQIYDARDLDLRGCQNEAKRRMCAFNRVPAENVAERERILREMFGYLGSNARVNQPIYVDYGNNIFLGNNSFINMHCTLQDTGRIVIGCNTMIGPDVKIYTAMHSLDGYERFWHEEDGRDAVKTWAKEVRIGDYVWIGGGAIILPGVTIGNHTVIGAGSVVTHTIPDHVVACGNPCRVKEETEPGKE